MKEMEAKHRESKHELSSKAVYTVTVSTQCDLLKPAFGGIAITTPKTADRYREDDMVDLVSPSFGTE